MGVKRGSVGVVVLSSLFQFHFVLHTFCEFPRSVDFVACVCVWNLCSEHYSLAMLFLGGGVESEQYYPQWRRINQSIERPNVLNESLIKLIEGKR